MAGEGEERGSGFDDLFDDLDKFFAPEDRPDDPRRRGERGAQGADATTGEPQGRPGRATPAGSITPSRPESGSPDAVAEEDILPGDWLGDIEGLDLGEPGEPREVEKPGDVWKPAEAQEPEVAAAAAAPEVAGAPGEAGATEEAGALGEVEEPREALAPAGKDSTAWAEEPPAWAERLEPVHEDFASPEPVEGATAPRAGRRPRPSARMEPSLGSTAEMSQQDWSRLRQALGDEVGGEGAEVGGLQTGSEEGRQSAEDLFRYEDEPVEVEERHELTLEDLKKAPAEYQHLPRPEDEAPQEDRDAIRERGGTFLGEPEGVRDDFADVGERPVVPESADTGQSEEPAARSGESWEEPAARSVESWDEPAARSVESWEEPAARSGESWEEPAARSGESWDEPAISEVEAAADQMAEEFRTGLPPEEELVASYGRPSQPRRVKVGEPESLTGPSWEEPGSQVITSEPAAPAFAGRNMPMALLTAAVLAVLAVISIAIDKAFFAFIAGGVILVGQAEVYAAMHRKGYQPATALGLVLGGLMLAAAYLKGEQAMLFFVGLGLVLSFLWYMAAAPKGREGALGNIGATMLGLIYVPLLAGFLMIILAQPLSGRALTLAILGMTFLYDAAAFVVGSLWGSRALAPTVSPKKSWEGLLAATFITFIVSIAVLPSIDPLTLGRSVGLALVIAVFAPLGDLAESLVKRDLGVKDMGSVLPGHGGIMDRIDSALFVIPAAFVFLRLIF
jgi:phosphatidate cytidylyltransferase